MTDKTQNQIELLIAQQCAPVLAKVKPSNILILKAGDDREVCSCLSGTQISCHSLFNREHHKVWFVYHRDKVQAILKQEEYQIFLEKEGYEGLCLDEMLEILRFRFECYQNRTGDFPHELGIFLGYPLADVKGFIEHKGKDFLYQGYWKVYEDVEDRKRLFSIYTAVKQEIVKEIETGKALWQAAGSLQALIGA